MIIDGKTELTWGIAAVSTAAVILRPFKLPEAIWACLGAVLLVILGLLPAANAATAVGKGLDVYLFLTGMMLLSEIARSNGVFDWVAAQAVKRAAGSPARLFRDIFLVGTVVTAFLSNDATAVVLTPAVFAAAKKAKCKPLPLLFICAFVANAASFVLPISNPANLVLYGDHTPALFTWLKRFALPSIASIVMTFFALRWTQTLEDKCEEQHQIEPLSQGGKTALAGIALTAVGLLTASALDTQLGAPTCVLGVLTTAAVLLRTKSSPLPILKDVSWSVLPLVAGLFVLVESLDYTGVISHLASLLGDVSAAVWGVIIAFGCNLINNLPAGLIASSAISQGQPAQQVIDCLLIGVDLGPNLSVTGSLATILWLSAIRREGEEVGFWQFLKVGALVMPAALIFALATRLILN